VYEISGASLFKKIDVFKISKRSKENHENDEKLFPPVFPYQIEFLQTPINETSILFIAKERFIKR